MNKEIKEIKKGGKIIASLFLELEKFLKEGITDFEIDSFCNSFIINKGGYPAALNYQGFPNSVCISINNIVCHGISTGKILKNKDIVSIDCVVLLNGYFADSCWTYMIGTPSQRHMKLVETSYKSMMETISLIKEGIRLGDLGFSMHSIANSMGFDTVKEFSGHGIGEVMHKDPNIPFFGKKGEGIPLKEGDIITIEPMLVEKKDKIKILEDNWTAVTVDGGYSSQFEHTILVKKYEAEILTPNQLNLNA